jgi:hypothetical protein
MRKSCHDLLRADFYIEEQDLYQYGSFKETYGPAARMLCWA